MNSISTTTNLAIFITPFALLLTSCTTVDESGGSSTASDYELGEKIGYQDGHGGLPRTSSRHEASYSEADRADFSRGYEVGYNKGIKPGAVAPASFGQPLSTVNGQGSVTIMEGDNKVTVCKTASPNIEQTRFIKEQNQVVVKSRGSHGPATVELFNSRTGRLEGSVKAYEISKGGLSWAAGMAD